MWIEKTVFFSYSIYIYVENRKKQRFLKCPPPPPRDQANPFAFSCSFILHTSYIQMVRLMRGEKAVKMLKNNLV